MSKVASKSIQEYETSDKCLLTLLQSCIQSGKLEQLQNISQYIPVIRGIGCWLGDLGCIPGKEEIFLLVAALKSTQHHGYCGLQPRV